MKKLLITLLALALCLTVVPVMAEDEPGDPNTLLSPGDTIWIAISPMESHPMYIDRPAPTIPTIPGYPIRVAVYSNPYRYLTTDEDGNPIWGEIFDPSVQNFSVLELGPYLNRADGGNGGITLRINNESGEYPVETGAKYKTLHKENDNKWEFVFYVRDMDELNSDVERFFFVAENITGIQYQGSGLVSVRETSQSDGGGGDHGPSDKKGGGGKH